MSYKEMLSEKMGVSFMRPITILALAFIALPVIAVDDFDATFSVESVSSLSEHNAVYKKPIVVTLTFGAKVNGTTAKSKLTILIEDKFGALTALSPVPDIKAKDFDRFTPGDQNDSQTFVFTIPADRMVNNQKVDVTDANDVKVHLYITKGVPDFDPFSTKTSKQGQLTIDLVGPNPTKSVPTVIRIATTSLLLVPVSGYTGGAFNVAITLSELPKTFTKDHISVAKGIADDPVYLGAIAAMDGKDTDTTADIPTGRDRMHHQYLVRITPKVEDGNLVIKVRAFEDPYKGSVDAEGVVTAQPTNWYLPPANEFGYAEGYDKLTLKLRKAVATPRTAGFEVIIPKEKRIPKDGYLIIAANPAMTGIRIPTHSESKAEPKASERRPAELKYNVIQVDPLPNLETFLAHGGTIDLIAPENVIISEILWGSDASLATNSHSQWIEIQNRSGKSLLTGDNDYKLIFYRSNEPLPLQPSVWTMNAIRRANPPIVPSLIMDRVGTITATSVYWSIAGKGQSGRTGTGELGRVPLTQPIISMYRVMNTAGAPMDGRMPNSWRQSTQPSLNFDPMKGGNRIGSPGAARIITASEAAAAAQAAAEAAAAEAAKIPVPIPRMGYVYISEIMFVRGGVLPQWIEIANGSDRERVDLSRWTLTIENAVTDADASVSVPITLTIPEGTQIHPSRQHGTPSTLLVVTQQGRNNIDGGSKGRGQILNLWNENRSELMLAGVTKPRNAVRYALLSDEAFLITLAPPTTEVALAHTAAGDTVGNLGADGTAAWSLPMSEDGGRSSIIRRHVPTVGGSAEPEDGTMKESWILASDTAFGLLTYTLADSYYGAADDVGTPGFRAGSALPVELSHFRPARDKATGAAVITWSTQSELNNAGFYIKRSQQRNGEFKVINATMIAGAGTTSEKQFYTYTDTTAQPNVVYYYQIEDVSLDGNRQTLTRGIRLKGHIGAAGKATTTWGELKTSHE